MTKTENFNLNQWESTDPIRREDFNADNAAIDAALGQCAKLTVGSYTGTGTCGADSPNTLTFDFIPKVVIVQDRNLNYGPLILFEGITDTSFRAGNSNCGICATWSADGKTVSWYSYDKGGYYASAQTQLNQVAVYPYFALG